MLLFPSPYVAATGGSAALIAQNVAGGKIAPGSITTNWESNSITIGSAANRLLIASLSVETNTATNDLSSTSITFGASGRSFGTGTAMTIKVAPSLSGSPSARPRAIIAVLPAPATGAGTVQVTFGPSSGYGMVVRLYEITGADQTHTNYLVSTLAASGLTTVTSLAPSINSVPDGSALLSVLAIQGGDYSSEISLGAGTLNVDFSGTNGFSDASSGHGSEEISTGGNLTRTYSWTTARTANSAMIAIPPA